MLQFPSLPVPTIASQAPPPPPLLLLLVPFPPSHLRKQAIGSVGINSCQWLGTCPLSAVPPDHGSYFAHRTLVIHKC